MASAGPLVKAVSHFRKNFPKEVTADTLRKLGIAPKNESYVINVLRFLGVIDEEGQKVSAKAGAFVQHQDQAFAAEFGKVVREAYEEIFELHNDAAWTLDRDALTQFFRTTDHSSDVVGSRQASTFSALAALSGHAEIPKTKASQGLPKSSTTPSTKPKPAKAATAKESLRAETKVTQGAPINGNERNSQVGLTVRIEVNLPASGDQETYDRIFRSIRANLIDGAS
ncbi:DUF5343 domain-containing protein [Dyella marensis]